jgi:hypothetical protein
VSSDQEKTYFQLALATDLRSLLLAFTAQDLLTGIYCLHNVSKDVDGQLLVLASGVKVCSNPVCDPLTLVQNIDLQVKPNKCDSALGAELSGSMRIGDLTTVFTGRSEHLRGMHAGNFHWNLINGGVISGSIEGITNAGTARPPNFPQCQGCEECDQDGLLTGKLSATGSNIPSIPVPDFNVEAVYRLSWDPIANVGGDARVVGCLEGVLIMPCQ